MFIHLFCNSGTSFCISFASLQKKYPLKKDSSFLSRALFAVQFEFTVWMWGDYAVKDPFFSVEGSCLCGSKV